MLLGQREDERDWLQLRYDDQPGRIGGMDDVALVDEADAGAALDRRGDRSIAELHLRIVDRRLIAPDRRLELADRRRLRVDALARGEFLLATRLVAREVELGVLELRLILCLLRRRLVECCLERPR